MGSGKPIMHKRTVKILEAFIISDDKFASVLRKVAMPFLYKGKFKISIHHGKSRVSILGTASLLLR